MILKLPLWDWFEKIWESEFDALEFGAAEYWVAMFVLLLIAFLVFIIAYLVYDGIYNAIDRKRATVEHLSGEVVDKRYNGEQSHSGTGTVLMPNTSGGIGVGVVSTSSHSPEEFLLFVRADKVYKIEVGMQEFYSITIGDKIRFERTIGGLSKEELYIELS